MWKISLKVFISVSYQSLIYLQYLTPPPLQKRKGILKITSRGWNIGKCSSLLSRDAARGLIGILHVSLSSSLLSFSDPPLFPLSIQRCTPGERRTWSEYKNSYPPLLIPPVLRLREQSLRWRRERFHEGESKSRKLETKGRDSVEEAHGEGQVSFQPLAGSEGPTPASTFWVPAYPKR